MTTALQQDIAHRLKQARRRAGHRSAAAFIRQLGLKESVYNSHEAGRRGIPLDTLRRYARSLDVPYAWLLLGDSAEAAATVPVVGYVGAGAEVYPIDDHAQGGGLEEVEAPPHAEAAAVVAVMVRGDSMYPAYHDGDVIYYGEQASDLADCVNRECVVRLDDGRTMVKLITRGSRPDLFTLLSYSAPPITDVRVTWASRVAWVKRA